MEEVEGESEDEVWEDEEEVEVVEEGEEGDDEEDWEDVDDEYETLVRGVAAWDGSSSASGSRSASRSGSGSRSASPSGPRRGSAPASVSGLAAVGGETKEADEDFELWRDAEPSESVVPVRWLRDRGALADDDITLDGEVLSREQRREVRKENYIGLPRPTRPSGQRTGQALEPLANFTDHVPGPRRGGDPNDGLIGVQGPVAIPAADAEAPRPAPAARGRTEERIGRVGRNIGNGLTRLVNFR
jgi:hypothetical protein